MSATDHLPRDSYDLPAARNRKRRAGCACRVSCLGFRCPDPGHQGDRDVPWCCGGTPDAHDPRGELCAACWYRRKSDQEARDAQT